MPTDLPNSLPSSITSLYDGSSNALVSKGKRYETEIGDVLQADFLPQIKVKRWGNDGNLSLRFPDAKPQTRGTVTASGNAISWEKGGYKVRFYDKGGFDEDGGLEFEIELAQKPPANSIAFTIQTKNLAFYYQGPLTEKEVAAGMTRPDNVVGSYAVYHVSKRDNEYETGKAFHIYRPWAQDANGTRVWCDFVIDATAGTATLTVPQAFLDAAAYPVIIDPTFGYTTVGASNASINNSQSWGIKDTPGSTGTLSSISVYIANVGFGTLALALYDDNGSNHPGARVATGSQAPTGPAWNTISMTGAITSGAKWLIAAAADAAAFNIRYDTGSMTNYSGDDSPPADPCTAGTVTTGNIYSIYGTFVEPAAAAGRFRALLGVGQ